MAKAIAKMRKLPDDLTLTVTIIKTPEFRFRLWLGKLLLRMAVKAMGCKVEFVGPEAAA